MIIAVGIAHEINTPIQYISVLISFEDNGCGISEIHLEKIVILRWPAAGRSCAQAT